MKQLLVTIIAICYAFGSAEVSLHFHFCGKVFQYISLFQDEEKDSCCGESDNKQDCCSSDVVKGDVDDHKQAPKIIQVLMQSIDDAYSAIAYDFFQVVDNVSQIYKFTTLHPPPLISTKVYLDNCVFLI